jgi:hypothetical protein
LFITLNTTETLHFINIILFIFILH